MTLRTRTVFLAFALLAGSHCNDPATISQSGGASETINARLIIIDTIAAVVLDTALGKPLSVQVYDAAYKPYEEIGYADSLSDTGMVVWNAPSAGTYNFYLTLESGKAAFVPGISLASGVCDTVSCVLDAAHTIAGSFKERDSIVVPDVFVLYIVGSPFVTLSDSLERFALCNLPSGEYTLTTRPAYRFYFTTNDYVINTDSMNDGTRLYLTVP